MTPETPQAVSAPSAPSAPSTPSAPAEAPHVDVGAYALGLLEEPDRRAFEAHLASCPRCHEELGVLRGVAATLDGMGPAPVPDVPAPPDPAVLAEVLRRRGRRERRRRVARMLTAAAVGAVLVGGAGGAGLVLGAERAGTASGGTAALLRDGHRASATDPRTGVTGTVAMQPAAWGTRVALELGNVRGPLRCRLVAVDRAGNAHTVAGWSVPAGGYGPPGSDGSLTLQGGTGLWPSDIGRFEVRTLLDGRTLLTVPL